MVRLQLNTQPIWFDHINNWEERSWRRTIQALILHFGDVIMGVMASQITSLEIVYLAVYSGGDQRKHQSSAPLVCVRGINRWTANSPHINGQYCGKCFHLMTSSCQLFDSLFRRRSKKTSKLRVTGLCAGISPVNGEFPAQMASTAENVSIWWHHHVGPVV